MKKKISIKTFCFITVLCFCINGLNAQNTAVKNNAAKSIDALNVLNGVWEGSAYQYNISDSWRMILICNAKGNEIKINYPSFPCGGDLILIGTKDNTILLQEKITYGSCINNLIIELTQTGDGQMDYMCHYENSTTVVAQGKISKSKSIATALNMLNGTWKGSAYQHNTNNSWDIILTCNAENGEITVEYPTFPCGGNLILIETKDNTIILREKLTHGRGSCIDNLIIELTQTSNNELDYICHYENSTTVVAQGKLSK